MLDKRRIGTARLPLWCAAVLLACALFSASGCAGCSADAGAGDLLATTEQAQQAVHADGDGAFAASSAAGVDAEASGEAGAEPDAEPDAEASEGAEGAAEQAETGAVDAAPAETGESASGAPAGSKPSGGSGASGSRSASRSGSAPASVPDAGADSRPDPAREPSSSSASDDAPAQPSVISVEVVFDSSNAAKFNPKFPSSLGTFTVELPAGATAYDALVETGVAFTTKGGNYIDSIGGIAEKQCGAGSGWMYAVNGAFPSKSAMKLELASGDKVRWAYTVTMGDV